MPFTFAMSEWLCSAKLNHKCHDNYVAWRNSHCSKNMKENQRKRNTRNFPYKMPQVAHWVVKLFYWSMTDVILHTTCTHFWVLEICRGVTSLILLQLMRLRSCSTELTCPVKSTAACAQILTCTCLYSCTQLFYLWSYVQAHRHMVLWWGLYRMQKNSNIISI